jgi:excisionase family DNA binding protein
MNKSFGSLDPASPPDRRSGDIKDVAKLLKCSEKHVQRMVKKGDIPPGFKLGRLRRWNLSEIEAFIASGCKPVSKAGSN